MNYFKGISPQTGQDNFVSVYLKVKSTGEHHRLDFPVPTDSLPLANYITQFSFQQTMDLVSIGHVDLSHMYPQPPINENWLLLDIQALTSGINEMDEIEKNILSSLYEAAGTEIGPRFCIELAKNIDKFELYPGVENAGDLGYWLSEDRYTIDNFSSEEAYNLALEREGNIFMAENGGKFVQWGYLYQHDKSFQPEYGHIEGITSKPPQQNNGPVMK